MRLCSGCSYIIVEEVNRSLPHLAMYVLGVEGGIDAVAKGCEELLEGVEVEVWWWCMAERVTGEIRCGSGQFERSKCLSEVVWDSSEWSSKYGGDLLYIPSVTTSVPSMSSSQHTNGFFSSAPAVRRFFEAAGASCAGAWCAMFVRDAALAACHRR